MRSFALILFICSSLLSQSSRIELKTHYSFWLGSNKQYNILFPEGYDSETDRYPVVYLFRGAVDEWADQYEDASRRGNIKTVYDSLIARRRIGKMILVMPGLGAPASMLEYSYVVNELIPLIDSLYRTVPTRWFRGMDGFSLGGLTTTNLLAAAPQFFTSVGSYDGTLSLFDNTKFSNASAAVIEQIKKIRLLYHTASNGGNNNTNNTVTFNILNGKGVYNFFPSFVLHPTSMHNWYFADWHVGMTLPLHYEKMRGAPNNLNLLLKNDPSGTVVSGSVPVSWARAASGGMIRTRIFFSGNDGATWKLVHTSMSPDSSIQWNTLPHSDGTQYRLKLFAAHDTLYGEVITGRFTINNPGNGAPEVELLHLEEGDTLAGNHILNWSATDPESDPLMISVSLSVDDGKTWTSLGSTLPNNGSTVVNTRLLPNSNSVRIKIVCSDGTLTDERVSPRLILHNKRIPLLNAQFEHWQGNSDATLSAVAMWPESLSAAAYTISFSETGGVKTYSVFNNKGLRVVTNATELDGTTEGPSFDGFRLLIRDITFPTVWIDSTGWTKGTSPLTAEIKPIDIVTESGTVSAIPTAADYEIRWESSIVDTSLSLYGAVAQPVNFLVWNMTEKRKTKFLFVEIDGNGGLSRNDELYLIEQDSSNTPYLSWHIQFVGNEGSPAPVSGDRYSVRILKPLTKKDFYQFTYVPTSVGRSSRSGPESFSLSQNFPNPFNPSTTIRFVLPERRAVSLTIHDVLGRELERPVYGILPAGPHSVVWSPSGLPSGVYYYTLRQGSSSLTRKMVLIK